jgi:hypothetical protein
LGITGYRARVSNRWLGALCCSNLGNGRVFRFDCTVGQRVTMRTLRAFTLILGSLAFIAPLFLSACSPEVGSKEWCQDMQKKPKGEWSTNDAAAFAKSCVFQ